MSYNRYRHREDTDCEDTSRPSEIALPSGVFTNSDDEWLGFISISRGSMSDIRLSSSRCPPVTMQLADHLEIAS